MDYFSHKTFNFKFESLKRKKNADFLESNLLISAYKFYLQKKFLCNKNRMVTSNISFKSYHIYSEFKGLTITTGSFGVPHIKKILKGGEDAFKIYPFLVVIADGVGGWNSKGIDPSLFSKFLVEVVGDAFDRLGKKIFTEHLVDYNIRNLLQNGINKTNHIEGSSTLSLVAFDEIEKKAYTALIGDSLVLVARANYESDKFTLQFVSSEQSHGFNIPYQVGKNCDSAVNAKICEHELYNKDIFITATDGLWDNLSILTILSILNQRKGKNFEINCQELSEILVKKAQVVSLNKNCISPFSLKAKQNNILHIGGKLDDITVIVTQIDIHEKFNGKGIYSENSLINSTINTTLTNDGESKPFNLDEV